MKHIFYTFGAFLARFANFDENSLNNPPPRHGMYTQAVEHVLQFQLLTASDRYIIIGSTCRE